MRHNYAVEQWTIDRLAAQAGTTVRHVRALQSAGVLPSPFLRGRTGLYGEEHRRRLAAVLRLQEEGFSLAAIGALLRAWEEGRRLEDVLGLPSRPRPAAGEEGDGGADPFEAFGGRPRRQRGSVLTVVPTTVLGPGAWASAGNVAS